MLKRQSLHANLTGIKRSSVRLSYELGEKVSHLLSSALGGKPGLHSLFGFSNPPP
jgi:hypothetical protein